MSRPARRPSALRDLGFILLIGGGTILPVALPLIIAAIAIRCSSP